MYEPGEKWTRHMPAGTYFIHEWMHARHKNSTPMHIYTHTEKNLDMVLAISSENNVLEFAVHSDVEFCQV